MNTPQQVATQKLRIGVDEFKHRLLSGEPITVLDARKDQAWESSAIKIRGAIRVQSANWHLDPSWLKDRFMVVY